MSLPWPLTICGSLENSLGSGLPSPDRLVQRAVAEPAPPRLPGSRAFSTGRWMPQRGQAGKLWAQPGQAGKPDLRLICRPIRAVPNGGRNALARTRRRPKFNQSRDLQHQRRWVSVISDCNFCNFSPLGLPNRQTGKKSPSGSNNSNGKSRCHVAGKTRRFSRSSRADRSKTDSQPTHNRLTARTSTTPGSSGGDAAGRSSGLFHEKKSSGKSRPTVTLASREREGKRGGA